MGILEDLLQTSLSFLEWSWYHTICFVSNFKYSIFSEWKNLNKISEFELEKLFDNIIQEEHGLEFERFFDNIIQEEHGHDVDIIVLVRQIQRNLQMLKIKIFLETKRFF